jgi:hypothetical protein
LAKTNRTTMVTNKMNGFLKGIVAWDFVLVFYHSIARQRTYSVPVNIHKYFFPHIRVHAISLISLAVGKGILLDSPYQISLSYEKVILFSAALCLIKYRKVTVWKYRYFISCLWDPDTVWFRPFARSGSWNFDRFRFWIWHT